MALPGAGRGARGKVRAAPFRAVATAGPRAGRWRLQPPGAVLGAAAGSAGGGAAAPRPASRRRAESAAPARLPAGAWRASALCSPVPGGGAAAPGSAVAAGRGGRLGPARPGRDAGAGGAGAGGGAEARAAGNPVSGFPALQARRCGGTPPQGRPRAEPPRPRPGLGSEGPRGGSAASRGLCAAPAVRGSPGSGRRSRGVGAPSLACGGAELERCPCRPPSAPC